MNNKFQNWVNKLGQGWVEKNPKKVIELLADDVRYYENVLDKPHIGKDKVYELWKGVPDAQEDISFKGEVLMAEGSKAVINWRAEFTKVATGERFIDNGIFLIELNKEGKCTLFKQWETIRNIKN